jgi:non-specific protein-tyrosine kinase
MELRQYIKPIFRWWWLIVLSTGIAAVASYLASSQQPKIYQTSTTLLVGQVTQKTDVSGQDFYITEQLAESYAQIAVRQPVLQATIDSLGLDMGWQGLRGKVYVQSIPRTQLLLIAVSDTIPERAPLIADEIANQLILQSPRSPQNQARLERSGFVKDQLDSLESRIDTAQSRVEELEGELATALSARQIQDLQTEIANLETLIDGWHSNYTELLDFLEGGDSPNYLTIIEPAQIPYSPISPNVKTNVLLAAAVGFALALGAALLLEYLDDTIKATEDLNKLSGLIALGGIGRIGGGKEYKDKLITSQEMFTPTSESYRMIRSNLQFMGVDQPTKTILVTSSVPGEGKSTTATNLAVVMAQADRKTIIIDTDLRRPKIHKVFGIPNLAGLTDLLRLPAETDITPYLQQTKTENLYVMTSGPLPPNPSELLASKRMTNLLKHLREVADVVIFDTPPIMAVTDAIILSRQVDGVALVVHANRTRREVVRQSVQNLNQVGANILGAVLNKVSDGKTGYYYYYSVEEGSRPHSRQRSGLRQWIKRPFFTKKTDYA